MADEKTEETPVNNDENKTDKKKKKKDSSSNELKGIGIFGKIVGLGIVVWLISISYYAFTFFILGMLPSILSIMIDKGAGRFASKTVTACNFTAIIPYIFDIGLAYERDIFAKQLMSDMTTWIVIYGFSAIGWMLIWILPNLSLIFITTRADMKVKSLINEQKEILQEWGEEVKTGRARIPKKTDVTLKT